LAHLGRPERAARENLPEHRRIGRFSRLYKDIQRAVCEYDMKPKTANGKRLTVNRGA